MKITVNMAGCPNGLFTTESDRWFTADESKTQFVELYNQSPALAYFVQFGVKQGLVDAYAKSKGSTESDTAEKRLALVEKKLANVIAGKLSVRATAATPSDPIVAEAQKLARATWNGYTADQQKVQIAAIRAAIMPSATDEEVVADILSRGTVAKMDEAAKLVANAKSIAAESQAAADAIIAAMFAAPVESAPVEKTE